ncbi:hypothetical protein [Microbulbifer taiwanensis]|uniref:hypothetical protein n=1 Tax=Microbulbifer taiwanensis TaxID=986746 RepID=UPI0036157C86
MATYASLAGLELPKDDREGKPIIFDSYDMTPVLAGSGKSPRNAWFYFTENELTSGAARVGQYKAVFNLRGDDGADTGGLSIDTNLGWKGPEKYVAISPQIFDLWMPPGALRNIHEQLHRAHLDTRHLQRGNHGADEELYPVSATQAAE